MKLKNIFLIASVAGFLFSCVAEDIIDQPTPKGDDTTLNLTLNMGDIIATKAYDEDIATNYKYATTKEINVNHVVIAIFRVNYVEGVAVVGDTLGYKLATGAELASTTYEGKAAYSISGVKAKTGDVRILAIANSEVDFSTFKTYKQYEDAIETTTFNTSFNPENLVKSGYKDMKLTPENYNTTKIVVPMTQLAARVDLVIDIQLPKENLPGGIDFVHGTGVFDYVGKNLQNAQSSWAKYEIPIDGNLYTYEFLNCKASHNQAGENHSSHDVFGLPFYNPFTDKIEYCNHTNSGVAVAEVKNVVVDSLSTSIQWALKINTITVNNIQTQTPVILEEVNPLPLLKGTWVDDIDSIITKTFRTTFYTYEKKLYRDTDDEVLKISFDSELLKGTSVTRTRYNAGTAFAIWIAGNPADKKTYGQQLSGWSSSELDRFVVVRMSANIDPTKKPVEDPFVVDESVDSFKKTFELVINPKYKEEGGKQICTDGLIHGNLYRANISFVDLIKTPTLDYNVVNWANISKNIPDFK